jgi:uncharacterized protein (DUF2252 family)
MNAANAIRNADAGRALRARVPRRSQAAWKPPARRRDPIDLLIASGGRRMPELLPLRYGRMMQSPFAFYRGAAAIMASDLAHTASTGIHVQACGDCHLMNFGGFATPERRIVFDINDFDETLPAPWEWDLKRLATSFVVAGRNNGLTTRDTRDVAARVAGSYREHIRRAAEMRLLERWYDQIGVDDLIETLASPKWKRWVRGQVAKAVRRSVHDVELPGLVTVDGRPRIEDVPPLIVHQHAIAAPAFERVVKEAFRRYRSTLAPDRQILLDRYALEDVAVKVVGVGSVGTWCAVALLVAGGDDALFLQVKEASPSVLAPYAGKSRFSNDGQRVVVGQRLMQAASDLFLGWTGGRGRHFYVRQLRDVKVKPVIEAADASRLMRYAQWCGWALARAHAKSSEVGTIAGYLGASRRFDDAIARFALAYADQNERDHASLLKAVQDGRIQAVEG